MLRLPDVVTEPEVRPAVAVLPAVRLPVVTVAEPLALPRAPVVAVKRLAVVVRELLKSLCERTMRPVVCTPVLPPLPAVSAVRPAFWPFWIREACMSALLDDAPRLIMVRLGDMSRLLCIPWLRWAKLRSG